MCITSQIFSFCEKLEGRQISVVIASDIDGGWRNLGGNSRFGQCNNHMNMISDTVNYLKQTEPESIAESSYPSSIITYVEFDRNGYEIIVGSDNTANVMPVSLEDMDNYMTLLEDRCDTIYQDRTCSNADGQKTQLKELLIDIRDNEALYGFDTTSPEYNNNGNRDRYIILFNNCKLPSSDVADICDEMEDYIRNSGINVMIVNQGYDGFVGEIDTDDYILCLAEYDQDRIYTNERRDRFRFDIDGIEATIVPGICGDEPSPNPTVDPTASPITTAWISPSEPLMPRVLSFQTIGKWKDEIFLLFGRTRDDQQQAFTYNLNTGSFTDHGNDILPEEVFNNNGYGQYYTQSCNQLFMYPQSQEYLLVFDLSDSTNWYNPSTISGVNNMFSGGCIASNDDYLFTVGGGPWNSPYNNMQMYDLRTLQWINEDNLPTLKTKRGRHSCVVDNNNQLYAIGGFDNYKNISSIERVDIEGITSNAWQYINDLSTGNYGSRAISYFDSVFVIGGRYYTSSTGIVWLDIVHIIDINTGIVTVSSDKLLYGISNAGVAIAYDTMYVFGGRINNIEWETDKWQYYKFSEAVNEDVCEININDDNEVDVNNIL